ncbi:MAG: hypothetical protein V4649_09860 [Bacteroidota bacterium]
MKLKRKISIRKILQVFLTIVVTTGCVVAMVSASRIEEAHTVKSVAVHIKNAKKYHFIDQKEVMDLVINNRNVDIAHTTLAKLDIHSMEQVLKADPWVADAQVYVDNERILHMYVTQRVPVARLFTQDGNSCYIDKTLSLMPLSASYTYYTTVVTNVPALNNDSASWAMRAQIVSLAQAIRADSFWSAQVSQVAIDSVGKFELLPVLGDHRILFGDTSRMHDKFSSLFTFYTNVLNRIGWDKYEILDLRFKGQVVASPSLPYKGPVDKAVVTMNWISSIEETEARKDTKDSLEQAEFKIQQALLERERAAKRVHRRDDPVQKPVAAAAMPAPAAAAKKAKAAPKAAPKPVAKPTAKLKAKPVVKLKAKAAKPAKKAPVVKAKLKANDKKNNSNKQKKQTPGKPKYEYPAKGH